MASRTLDRYELASCAQQSFDTLSGGQQARFQILLLELSGANLLLLDAVVAYTGPRHGVHRGATRA
ncbi:MAG TPA: hypothetical protein VN748_15910 [Pseudonocardiaceae bacterium]|nr:hypothetical protein [Pseudonocardiaceae bacterium]